MKDNKEILYKKGCLQLKDKFPARLFKILGKSSGQIECQPNKPVYLLFHKARKTLHIAELVFLLFLILIILYIFCASKIKHIFQFSKI